MTIEQQIQALAQIKSDLKDAILAQGVDIDDSTPFADYATKVSSISGGGGIPGYEFKTNLDIEVTGEVNE